MYKLKDLKSVKGSLAKKVVDTKLHQSYIFLRQFKEFPKSLSVVTSEQARLGLTIKLSASKPTNIMVTNLKANDYELVFFHDSNDAVKQRKFFYTTLYLSNKLSTKHTADNIGFNYNNKLGIFNYMGGGKKYGPSFASLANMKISKKAQFVILSFTAQDNKELEGYFLLLPRAKVNQEYLKNLARNLHQRKQLISADLDKKVTTDKIVIDANTIVTSNIYPLLVPINKPAIVIYANISPNVVDGSSVWLSSIVDIISNLYHVILFLKEKPKNSIITSNIKNIENVTIFDPEVIGLNKNQVNEYEALEVIRRIDDLHPNIIGVLVRGLEASKCLVDDRVFKYRSICYLTDFYELKDGSVTIKDSDLIKQICLQAELLLIQTKQIESKLDCIANDYKPNFDYLPPSTPDYIESIQVTNRVLTGTEEIIIGYAGKIMPDWGVEELLEWVNVFNNTAGNPKISLKIVANKISAPEPYRKKFVGKILKLMDEDYITHYKNLNREETLNVISDVDYVWAYRPASFENLTLELSTKLVESVSLGKRVITYPSGIHKDMLGNNYPYYVENFEDFINLIKLNRYNKNQTKRLSNKIFKKHSLKSISDNLSNNSFFKKDLINSDEDKKICFAGHDYKFIDPYISYLKSKGYSIMKDRWEWGEPVDIGMTKNTYNWADIIFCEWGLANSVWYSNNNVDEKPIYIRVHLQEINAKALRFGKKINFDSITKVIFVSERVRDEYIELFNVDINKTVVIPNFVLDDEYILNSKRQIGSQVTLGMVGIVPTRKRLDRAVSLLEMLIDSGIDARLRIKGHRPENIDFMHGPARKAELDYYYKIYEKVDRNPKLKNLITFDDWGNDVAIWYQNIDFILSPSDFESFHYALADGVLSGCTPIIWDWDEAKVIYNNDWIVNSNEEAINRVLRQIKLSNVNILEMNRGFITKRYGRSKIFRKISSTILASSIIAKSYSSE